MEAIDSMERVGMHTHTITNITSYDVLVDPSIDGVVGEYQLDNYSQNVGNNRLKVFLTLYKKEYDRARRQNNAVGCQLIVTEILLTLNTKCVPTGRFLINALPNTNDNRSQLAQMSRAVNPPAWHLMGIDKSKQLIHGILNDTPPPLPYRYRQQQMQMQMQEQQAGGQSNRSNKKDTDELKRRRTSSLLRRSASDSLLGDLKKVSRFDQQLQQQQQQGLSQNRRMSKEEPIWLPSGRSYENGVVSLNRMDVILTSNREALDPNSQSIGNNRLHILVAMQSGKYQLANDRTKEIILDEVIQTVNSFWKGRFLTESLNGSYEVLENIDAKRALRNIFDTRSGQNLFSQASSPALSITPNSISSGLNRPEVMGSGSGMHGKMNTGNRSSRISGIGDNINNGNQFRSDSMNAFRNVSASASAIQSGNTGLISNDTKKNPFTSYVFVLASQSYIVYGLIQNRAAGGRVGNK